MGTLQKYCCPDLLCVFTHTDPREKRTASPPPPHPPSHLLEIMVLVQQSAQQFSHMALLLWFFINQRQVFSSQLVNSCWCERLSGLIVCHWLLQSVVCILTSHSSGATDTNRPPGCLCGAEASLTVSLYVVIGVICLYYFRACRAEMEESSTLAWQNISVKLIWEI